jgi:glucuronate isomerase
MKKRLLMLRPQTEKTNKKNSANFILKICNKYFQNRLGTLIHGNACRRDNHRFERRGGEERGFSSNGYQVSFLRSSNTGEKFGG